MVERVVRAASPVAIASSLDGQHFYVARFDAAANSIRAVVSVLDARTGEEVAAIPAGQIEGNRKPSLGITVPSMGIATSPDGKHAFVVAGNADGGTLAIIDIASNTPVSTIKTDRLDQRAVSVGLAISPDGRRAFVPSGQALAVLDTAAAAVVDFIHVGEVSGVAIAPDGRHLYATHAVALNVIDLVAGSIPVRIALPSAGGGIACTPDARLVYVASRNGSVLAIEAATNGVIANIPVSGPAEAIAIAAIRK
jgi:YVTN family beta-propeller protein